jgi:hypothetical protein
MYEYESDVIPTEAGFTKTQDKIKLPEIENDELESLISYKESISVVSE